MRLDDSDDLNVSDQGNTGGGFGGGGLGGFGGGGGGGLGGGLGGLAIGFLPLLFSRLGCLGTAIVIGLFLFFSGGLGGLLGTGGGGGGGVGGSGYSSAGQQQGATAQGAVNGPAACHENDSKRLSCNVMANANGVWARLLPGYTKPELKFYTRNGDSGCGAAQSAMGPFYCPSDQGVYLDTEFFDELQNKFHAGGDFAEGYVIAHEMGHHIQHLEGLDARVREQQQSVGRAAGNALQVKMELQADCYAGVWAANARTKSGQAVIEPGDVQEGMRAAQAIGDDTLQQEAQGRVTPESFTHGTSAQRQFWLKRGLDTGDPKACDTFAAGAGGQASGGY